MASPETSRTEFLGLDERLGAVLRANRADILQVIEAVLTDFYRHVARYPETARFFRDPAHVGHAKAMQLRHWSVILEGRFDAPYFASVARIGEVHNKLGLEPRWYIGAYSFLLGGITERLLACDTSFFPSRRRQRERGLLQTAILRAAMLDMDCAISVYIDAGKRDRRATLERLAASFRTSIGEIAAGVAAAAQELEGASERLTRASERSRTRAAEVEASSLEASANVQTVAAATEELSVSVREIGRQVNESYAFPTWR